MPPEIDTAPSVASPPAAAPVAPPPAPVAAPAAPVAPAAAAPAAPKPTMLDAISANVDANAEQRAETNRGKGPRQPDGKFTHKVAADGSVPVVAAPAAPVKPAAKPAAAPGAPAEVDDALAMPEGLSAKGQERFQRLANEVKELRAAAAPVADLTTKLDTATRQVEYVKTAFHEHGVRPEQFDQATAVIGMFNRGDYDGARKILESQLQQIALITGKQAGPIDALANFPDLREAVDAMQITEQHALEVARSRAERFAGERQQQRTQQERQTQQQSEAAVQNGTKAVDAFCKRMQANDVDYSAVEEQLLPEIPNLIRGAHPSQWAGIVETNYRLLKTAAGKFRQTASPGGNALRPTGQPSPAQVPKSIFEAMHGHAAGPA